MDSLLRFLGGTPWWVFPLLVLSIWLGVSCLKPRVIPPGRLLAVPAVFLAWGLSGLLDVPLPPAMLLAGWLGGAVLGALPGAVTAPVEAMSVDRQRNRLFVPGECAPLILGVGVCSARGALWAVPVLRPELQETAALSEAVVSGLAAGYFLGWLLRVRFSYPRLREADLAPAGSL